LKRSFWLAAIAVVMLIALVVAGAAAGFITREPTNGDDLPGVDAFATPTTGETPEPTATPVPGETHTPQYDEGSARIVVEGTEFVSVLTGPDSPARTDERWNVYGTDLGIVFEMNDTIYLAFGDTWGRDGIEGEDWRAQILAIAEPDPEHGYVLTEVIADERGEAKELLPAMKDPGIEHTVVPTAAIAVGDRMFMHYMSIRHWELYEWEYKHPVINGAGIAYSDDGGDTWVVDENATWEGDVHWGQAAMAKDDDFVYVFGTLSGRFGSALLLRAPAEELLDPQQWEYWDGSGWSSDPDEAAEVVPAPVGELSVRWSPYHERWFMMYRNEFEDAIVFRTAERPEGPWDDERVVLTGEEYPTSYGPFMFPIDGPEVHFTMSVFLPVYQVYVMQMTVVPEP
jgi:hypothetical protein